MYRHWVHFAGRGAALFCLAALGCCLAAGPAAAALSFQTEKKYPDIGLGFKILRGGEPDPLAQPKTYAYTYTRGGVSSHIDLFDPHELWYAAQHAGQWRDREGNRMILGRATRREPEIPPLAGGKHVKREAFDAALAAGDAGLEADRADDPALAAWVAAFTGTSPEAPRRLRAPFRLQDAAYVPTDDAGKLVYLFRAKTRLPDGKAAPSEWFCLCLELAGKTPPAKARQAVETFFLPSVSALPRAATAFSRERKELRAPGAGTAAEKIPDSPARAAAKKSIANMKGWWFAETPEYLFLSDIRSALGKNLVRTLRRTLPAYRAALAKLVPPFSNRLDANVVRIFEKEADYKRAVGEGHEWSCGVWSPMHRELMIHAQGKDLGKTMEIIRHEGFHQYLFYANDMIENAMWYNEGHAVFCECAEISARGRVSFPENRRVRHLEQSLDEAARILPELLRADAAAFYAPSDARRQLNYTAAWALVYFLRKGAPSHARYGAYAPILGRYRAALRETKKWREATAAAFEGVDMARFQRDFKEFWKKGRKRAERVDPLAGPAGAVPGKQRTGNTK